MVTEKKQGGALGKGLDALISKKYVKDAEDDSKDILRDKDDEKLAADRALELNEEIIEGVLDEINKNPRISLWSAKSAAVLRFLKNTKPAFSISKEASVLIEEAVKQKYPEIWELFQEEDF
jgi:hypothetical protein